MQITITNGTLTQVQETLSASSGYVLPSSVTVTGATGEQDTPAPSISSNIFVGASAVSKILVGSSEISKIFIGNFEIYNAEGGDEPEPGPEPEPSGPDNIAQFIEDGKPEGAYENDEVSGSLLSALKFDNLFRDSNVTSISLPNVTECNMSVFGGCSYLTTIYLPKLTTLSTYASLYPSPLLTTLYIGTQLQTMCALNVTSNTSLPSTLTAIYVPASLVSTYQADANWSAYASIIRGV